MSYAFLYGAGDGTSDGALSSLIDRSITEIEIPYGVEEIGSYAFADCRDLTEITFPDSVKKIGAYAFSGSENIAAFHFGENVTEIGEGAFNGVVRVRVFDFTESKSIPVLKDVNAFDNIDPVFKIYVPFELYEEWIVAENWAVYKDRITYDIMPSTGLLYEYYSFLNGYGVTGRGSCKDSTIVIPETYDDGVHGELPVTCIYEGFENDQTLEEIILPENGCYINGYPFKGSSLKKVKNLVGGSSFIFMGLALEYVSILDGADISNGCLGAMVGSPVYDFSRHTSVPELGADYYITVGENTKILVPAKLYNEWISATNWTVYKDHIIMAPSTGLLYEYYDGSYRVIGRGSCTDSTIVIPETYDDGTHGEHPVKYIQDYSQNADDVEAFINDQTLYEIILPETGCSINGYPFEGSSLKKVKNLFSGSSFIFRGLALEYVSILDGAVISYGCLAAMNGSPVYDFSRHTSVAKLSADYYITVGENTRIIVPSFLYDEWISATNWTVHKDYIVSKDVKAPPKKDNFDVFIGAELLQETVNTAVRVGVGNNEILYDNGIPYLRIYGDGSSPEAYSHIDNIEGKVTGKYLVFAYRLPESNTETHGHFEVFANTTGGLPSGYGDCFGSFTVKDGTWQVAVVDIAEAIANSPEVVTGGSAGKFIARGDGTYAIEKLRIDWFNQVTSTGSYIDIAYVGICDSLEKARQADANYTGKCYDADLLVSKLGSSKAVKDFYNGMPYVRITDTTQARGEQFVELHSDNSILPDTSKYIGILYRGAPGQYAEVFISSDNTHWATNHRMSYDVSDGWHFGVMAINGEVYRDSVCRRLRFDYFNDLSASTQYSIDIGFVKFFGTEEEANDYYQIYKTKYNI